MECFWNEIVLLVVRDVLQCMAVRVTAWKRCGADPGEMALPCRIYSVSPSDRILFCLWISVNSLRSWYLTHRTLLHRMGSHIFSSVPSHTGHYQIAHLVIRIEINLKVLGDKLPGKCTWTSEYFSILEENVCTIVKGLCTVTLALSCLVKYNCKRCLSAVM